MSEIQKANSSLDERINEPEFKDLVQQLHAIVGDRVTGYMTKNFTLIERFVTKKNLVKLMDDEKLKEAQTEMDFRHRVLKLATEFKFKALEEKYDRWLQVIKLEYQSQFIAFVTEKQAQLRKCLDEKEADFFRDIRNKYERYEKNKDIPTLAANYLSYIQTQENEYFVWLQKLLDEFKRIADAKVLELNQ
jgi:hypothetical protein